MQYECVELLRWQTRSVTARPIPQESVCNQSVLRYANPSFTLLVVLHRYKDSPHRMGRGVERQTAAANFLDDTNFRHDLFKSLYHMNLQQAANCALVKTTMLHVYKL